MYVNSVVGWVVGFDIEFTFGHRNVATVQLAVEDLAMVVRVHKFEKLPPSLKSLLEDEHILKVGVGELSLSRCLSLCVCVFC